MIAFANCAFRTTAPRQLLEGVTAGADMRRTALRAATIGRVRANRAFVERAAVRVLHGERGQLADGLATEAENAA